VDPDPDPEMGDTSKGSVNIGEYAAVCSGISGTFPTGRIDGGVGMVLGAMP